MPSEGNDSTASGHGRRQFATMASLLQSFLDRFAIPVTRAVLVVTGVLFVVLICSAVVGRYLFSFPLAFIEDATRILLVWFFMLGIGLAFHSRAHVAITLLVDKLPPQGRYLAGLLAQLIGIVFVLHVAAGGFIGLAAAREQVEPMLGISGVWAAAAVPVGTVLLLVFQAALFFRDLAGSSTSR